MIRSCHSSLASHLRISFHPSLAFDLDLTSDINLYNIAYIANFFFAQLHSAGDDIMATTAGAGQEHVEQKLKSLSINTCTELEAIEAP